MSTVRNQRFHHVRGAHDDGIEANAQYDRLVANQVTVLDQLTHVGAENTVDQTATFSGPWADQNATVRLEKIGPHTAQIHFPIISVATTGSADITLPAATLAGEFAPDDDPTAADGETQRHHLAVESNGAGTTGLVLINRDGSVTISSALDGTDFPNMSTAGLLGGSITYSTAGALGTFSST